MCLTKYARGVTLLLVAARLLSAQSSSVAQCAATAASMTPSNWAPPPRSFASIKPGSARDAPLTFVADIPLPGAAKRFDYQSMDTTTGRLYIAHMYGARLDVFDTRGGRLLESLEGFPGATGVWAVPELHRIFVSVTGNREVAVVDDQTLKTIARVAGARFPDGIAYAPAEGKVFVSDESGETSLVIDARRAAAVGVVALGGEAGNTHYDAVSHCIVVAVQTRNELAALDPASNRVVARYKVPCQHPHGFLIDESSRLAFVSCEGDAKLLVVDLRTMRTTATHTVGDDPDVLAFDPGLGRLYVACESGTVSVFAERDGALTSLGRYRAPHAHSVAVDPVTHRVYLPLQDVNGRPVLRIMTPSDT